MNSIFRTIGRHYSIYGFLGAFRLIVDFVRTRIFYPEARLIRFPFEVRGRGNIIFSSGFTSGRYCRLEAYAVDPKADVISFGKNCQINDSVHVAAINKISIGDDVLIASRVFITDLSHGIYNGEHPSHPDSICRERVLHFKPVIVEANVWLGEGVVVLPGVTIGKSSIIGANSVVSKNIPAYSIAVGNPAKVIKSFNFITNKWDSC